MPHIDFPQTHCLAALSRRDITPPVGIYHRMWGAAKHDRSTGIHRPLTTTVLALAPDFPSSSPRESSSAQFVIAIDHCLLWADEMDALRQSVSRATGVPPEQLHLALSHTHAAGLMDPNRAELPGGELIAPYLDQMSNRVAEAVSEAAGALRPVRIVYGTARCDLAAHRDFWDEENQLFACGFNPGGPSDDTVLVARVSDERGKIIGTVVNYACHPTTLAWDNTLISPDYPGAMREVIEQASGAPCVFLQGASGDLGPRHGYVGDTAVADRNGRQLGHAALGAIESLPEAGTRFEYAGPLLSGATIGTWEYRPLSAEALSEKYRWQCETLTVPLQYRPDLPNRAETEAQLAHWQHEEHQAHQANQPEKAMKCRAQAERMTRQLSRLRGLPQGDALPLVAQVWRLGDALWVLLPGEHYNVLQRSLRERFPQHPLLLATVTDGWLPGYVPTADTYGRGIYQESIAIVAAGSLEKLIAAIGDRLASGA